MRVVFMGTPDFAVPVLDALHAAHEILAVYCQPPRPAGRGKADRKSQVQTRAEQLGLLVQHPSSLRSEDVQQTLAALLPDVVVVVAYGLILPQAVLDTPRFGCLNVHASLLPRWRGAAPIHRAIMAGDAKTGVCIMQMAVGLDTGPVLMRQTIAIGDQETTAELHDRLSQLGAEMIGQTLDSLPLPAAQQAVDGVTYAAKINKAEARVDFHRPAVEVDRLIRGLSPFPGAWIEIAGERVKLLRSRVARASGAPGQVLSGFTISCGDFAVEILEAQREGKRPMAASEVLKGLKLPERICP